jgi:histidine triad (HIT) family protein
MSAECIFCKIANGELPSTKVYEDEDTLAFLDIGPVVKGHTLVIPKKHYDPITKTPAEVLSKLIRIVQHIAIAQTNGLKADGINVAQANGSIAGQIIPHIHFHVIPRFKNDEHSWNWKAGKYDSQQEMQTMADAIRKNCGKDQLSL